MKKYFMISSLLLISASASASASAKITLFSATDATKHVLESIELAQAASGLPAGYDLGSITVQQEGAAPENSFELVLSYSPKEPTPAGLHVKCFISAKTQSQVIETGPGNKIEASELTVPVISGPICQH